MELSTADDFEPFAGQVVRVSANPNPVEVSFARVERGPAAAGGFRAPFVLYFESTMEVFLTDGLYDFDFGDGEQRAIGISQKTPRDGRRIYEAVFN